MIILIISVLENIVVDEEEIDSPRGGLSRGDKDALSKHHHNHYIYLRSSLSRGHKDALS